ncbi:MAG TPA: globin [Acidimicrobiales bacterium]|nr:globin [Acidimicrobiales bacterium]
MSIGGPAEGPGGGGGRGRSIPVGGQPSPSGEALPVISLYETLGGQPFFDELVDRFYRRVALDPVLRPLYPEDLTEPRRHLALFLGQYWGGPATYSEERGHPRLRLRHAPFVIDEPERDAWLRHMTAALDSLVVERDIHPVVEARLVDYFAMAADAMINVR